MNAVTSFDTHAFIKKVSAAGMPVAQAEALVEALSEGVFDRVATNGDLRELELRLGNQLKELELRLMTRLGALVAGSMALTVGILGALITLH